MIIDLPTGEKEFLITTLIDKNIYKYEFFVDLYFMRWGIEENYKFLKIRIEIENFSGLTVQAISQDFYATIFSRNAQQLLINEASKEMVETEPAVNTKKYRYQINKNVAFGAFKNKFIEMLFLPDAYLKAFCEKTKTIMKRSLVPIRKGRTFPRIRRNTRRKFHMNMRRCL